jgi:hypothetical protein
LQGDVLYSMAIDVETKDCTALSDAELAEMADICVEGPAGYDVGFLSKVRDEWVLVSQARDNGRLIGLCFCTLERIGGTPSLLWGLASVKRTSKRDTALRAIIADQFRRAILAFPDEDVLVGTRMLDASGFGAFGQLEDIVPRPGHKATGEERAWSRRLAKRFGVENQIDDRTFIVTGTGDTQAGMDIESLKPESIPEDVRAFFAEVDTKRGDALISFGWAMAETLAKYSPGIKP